MFSLLALTKARSSINTEGVDTACTTATNVTCYGYDPIGRLASTTSATASGAVTTQFLYDGVNLIGEYQSGALTQR